MTKPPRPSQKHRVYVVESHALAARYLTTVLSQDPALEVILSGPDLPADAPLSSGSSVLIVDADALPLPVVPYLRTVRTIFGDVRVLVIGKGASDDELCRLLFQGVSGFVSYDRIETEVHRALGAVLSGGVWAPPAVLQRYVKLSSAFASRDRSKGGALTPREEEVVGLLLRRLCNKEIASALRISERTVRFHLENIFDKIGVRDRHSVIDVASGAGFMAADSSEKADRGTRARYSGGSVGVRRVAEGFECDRLTARCRREVPVWKAA
jgi:DNA-binding NarL/FixJ family response regulator